MVLLLELSRGLACLWVVLFHLREFFEHSAPLLYRFAEEGMYGVPIFFVISGYVITYSAESSRKASRSPWVFLKNRAKRVYPVFWFSVAFILATPFLLEALSALRSGTYNIPDTALSHYTLREWIDLLLLTKVFSATSYDLYHEFSAVNAVYWTLAIEFQFYTVVFLALCTGRAYRVVIGLVSIIAIVLMYMPMGLNWGLFIHYWPAFAVGIGLAYLHRAEIRASESNRYGLCAAVLVFIAVVGGFYMTLPVHQYSKPTLAALAFGSFLWLVAGLENTLQRIKTGDNKLARRLLEPWIVMGTMSYSIYLLHLKAYLYPLSLMRQVADPGSLLFALILILATLLLCYPAYYYVERRFLSANYKKIHAQALSRAKSSGA